MRLGIIPAAGKADRWGGYPKELLPISSDHTFMSRAVDSLLMCGCDLVMVVTNPAKIHLHSYHLKEKNDLVFVNQQGEELWGAIKTAVSYPADEYFFMMPDTYVPPLPFPRSLKEEFSMGLFATSEPESFGMVVDGQIIDKQLSVAAGFAWGALAWKQTVVQFWSDKSYPSHTEAFNDAIATFGYGEWFLDYFFDIGSMRRYAEFLLSTAANPMIFERRSREKNLPTPSSERNLVSINASPPIRVSDK